MRTLIPTVVILSLIPFSLFASARSNSGGLAKRVAELEAQVEVLAAALQQAQEILQYVHIRTEEIGGLRGPHWIIEGANVHVWSGLGSTYPQICPPGPPGSCVSSNNLGNLIVGYNEVPPLRPPIRVGMHNLVVGPEHVFDNSGGFIAGRNNETKALGASVTGGHDNRAVNSYAPVSGGRENLANGSSASVSGGFRNVASGTWSSVGGGEEREAPDEFNWVAGELFEPN
jgi:hypothetical protein